MRCQLCIEVVREEFCGPISHERYLVQLMYRQGMPACALELVGYVDPSARFLERVPTIFLHLCHRFLKGLVVLLHPLKSRARSCLYLFCRS